MPGPCTGATPETTASCSSSVRRAGSVSTSSPERKGRGSARLRLGVLGDQVVLDLLTLGDLLDEQRAGCVPPARRGSAARLIEIARPAPIAIATRKMSRREVRDGRQSGFSRRRFVMAS